MGRKPEHDYTDPNFLLIVEGLARDGWDDKQIAQKFKLDPSYWCFLKNKYSQLSQSLKKGRLPLDIHVENSLFKRATGLKVKTIVKRWQVLPDGTQTDIEIIQETETELPPDTGAAMAWLKQRKSQQWNKEPLRVDHTSSDGTMTPKQELPTIVLQIREYEKD